MNKGIKTTFIEMENVAILVMITSFKRLSQTLMSSNTVQQGPVETQFLTMYIILRKDLVKDLQWNTGR